MRTNPGYSETAATLWSTPITDLKHPPEEGVTVGILDISKARGDVFLDRIAARLVERGIGVKRYRKATFTRPASTELKQQIATECNLVIEGLAD